MTASFDFYCGPVVEREVIVVSLRKHVRDVVILASTGKVAPIPSENELGDGLMCGLTEGFPESILVAFRDMTNQKPYKIVVIQMPVSPNGPILERGLSINAKKLSEAGIAFAVDGRGCTYCFKQLERDPSLALAVLLHNSGVANDEQFLCIEEILRNGNGRLAHEKMMRQLVAFRLSRMLDHVRSESACTINSLRNNLAAVVFSLNDDRADPEDLTSQSKVRRNEWKCALQDLTERIEVASEVLRKCIAD